MNLHAYKMQPHSPLSLEMTMVERDFGEGIADLALRGASFTNIEKLCQAIDAFITAHGLRAKPFI